MGANYSLQYPWRAIPDLDQRSCRLLTTRSISNIVSLKTTPDLAQVHTIAQGGEDMAGKEV
jgi:hypothetical protein